MKELETHEQLVQLLSIIDGHNILDSARIPVQDSASHIRQPKESLIDSIEPSALSKNIGYAKYINPSIDKKCGSVHFPCGVGEGDYGFIIHGLKEDKTCTNKNASVFALVYNYLIRNSRIKKDDYPYPFKNIKSTFELDYGLVLRYEMILLQLVKNNYMKNGLLEVKPNGNIDEFNAAVKVINFYLKLFSRLIGIEAPTFKVTNSNKGVSISACKKAEIYVENYTDISSLAREMWYGKKINYNLDEKNVKDLEFILKEISPFEGFKEGQFQALCSMLNSRQHAVCIMPTGSGKSLIYYFASILQPLPVFVVSPTDILIKDQIRNLERFHRFDNVSHLELTTENSFHLFEMHNNLLYLTPSTFQNRQLLQAFRNFNKELKVSYVVLDEIHCLSNWGHDFRPEYLMLSKNLNQFFDRTTFLGFTATANYSVVEDIQKQLDIKSENIFSPVEFEKYNIKYVFKPVLSEERMFDEIKKISNTIIGNGERAIVFTKNDNISEHVADAIGYDADVFTSERPEAYHQFADGLCDILVTSEDLGIGINFPEVNCTVHFGIPISKSEYVQEIGRAGRENESVTSYVIYLDPTEKNISEKMLKRETNITELSAELKKYDNDYSLAYKKMTNNADSPESLFNQLKLLLADKPNKTIYVKSCRIDEVEYVKRLLYIFFVTGVVNDWYSWRANDKEQLIDIMIDVTSTHFDEESVIDRMRNRTISYLSFMGNDRKAISRVSRAAKEEDIIKAYVDWYYEKYLYHHKEMFLDFLEFIIGNTECDSEKITDEIREFFGLPFVEIKADELYYMSISFKEASNKIISGVSNSTLTNIERIVSNRYSYQLDYMLFLGNWKRKGIFDVNRLSRLYPKLNNEEKKILYNSIMKLYPDCTLSAKWKMLQYFDGENVFGIQLKKAFDDIYRRNPRDHIFYGLYAKMANIKFSSFMGR